MKRRCNWSLQEQSLFFIQLGKLLSKGYSLAQAIEFLQIQQSASKQKDLDDCMHALRAGVPIHEAFSRMQFHSHLLGYVFFAEQHGQLAHGFIEAGEIGQMRARYVEQVKRMLRYPLFLFSFCMAMFFIFQQVLAPQFSHLLSSFHAHSAFSTFIFSVAVWLPRIFSIVFTMLILFGLFYFFFIRSWPIYKKMNMLMKIPIVSSWIVSFHTQVFSLQLSHLLKGGLSIYEALQIFEHQSHLPLLKEEAKIMKQQLCAGEKLDEIVQQRKYYEQELPFVIRHGQSNGELVQELFHYSQFSLQKLENRLKKIVYIIQPLLLSFIGIFVVLMYMAMLWPIFQLLNHI
ncbi:competence protein ComGB [Anoxybacillus tengchongensis]|uniref:Competence protein ComGB n=1 Tax=Anoxybacillus tengchongensis TaxID=576944 RepID=A0A7W9YNA7_9BACL|nr:competence type IV pilus assembly protein ComGB [Anoxybacillus tengchongensis]MBB6175314.1 competence protein ComGB [Anoxybacillus tengchongensis]